MAERINLPADLPENWAKGQTISPNGMEAGLSEKHGYNYLMKQVNDVQVRANEHSADLSNKANANDLGNKADKSNTYAKADVDYRDSLKVDKTPQAKYSITYSSPYKAHGQHYSYYLKSQPGICYISLAAERNAYGILAKEILAVLPVGFRIPTQGMEIPCVCKGGGEPKAGTLIMYSNGQIVIQDAYPGYILIFASFSFATY